MSPAIGEARRSTLTTGQNALSTAAEEVLAAKLDRLYASIKNDDGSINVFVGFSDAVTTSTGYLLKPGESIAFPNYIGPVYAIAASGTPSVSFMHW